MNIDTKDIKYVFYVSGFTFIGLYESYKKNFKLNFGMKRRMEKMFFNTLFQSLYGILSYKIYPLGLLFCFCKSIDLIVDGNDCLSSFRD